MLKRIIFLSALIFAAPSWQVAHASSEFMKPGEIRKTITGVRIMLQSPFGEFPLTYKSNGTVTGDGSTVGLGRFFAPRETGKWWIADNQLCQQWPTWYDGEVFCFKLQKTGDRSLYWVRDDGESGKARIVPLSG